MFTPDDALTDHAFRLCQQLLRIDTTNPPGQERAAADLLAVELRAAGLDPVILESAPTRANLVVRHRGTGAKPPLLLTAHLDVVEADPSRWEHPPFSGEVFDGCLWGRGAIDMKNMAAMSVALMCRLARDKVVLERDIIFAGVADEEAGCDYGSKWLCDHHPDLVRAEYAMGEQGGFNVYFGNLSVFTVQVAEKGLCWVKARVRGEPGHGSMPRSDSAVVKLSEAITRLAKRGLPTHATPTMQKFFAALAGRQPWVLRPVMAALQRPALLRRVLSRLPDPGIARAMGALLSNTASPTVLRAGGKINVHPGVAELEIDGRTLPGQTTGDFLRELSAVMGDEVEFEVIREAPPTVTEPAESPLLDAIQGVLHAREPEALVVPYLMPGYSDAKHFTRLGARWYGFAPVKFPKGMRFAELYHGHNERIPVEGLAWGTRTLAEVVTRFAAVP